MLAFSIWGMQTVNNDVEVVSAVGHSKENKADKRIESDSMG